MKDTVHFDDRHLGSFLKTCNDHRVLFPKEAHRQRGLDPRSSSVAKVGLSDLLMRVSSSYRSYYLSVVLVSGERLLLDRLWMRSRNVDGL